MTPESRFAKLVPLENCGFKVSCESENSIARCLCAGVVTGQCGVRYGARKGGAWLLEALRHTHVPQLQY